MRVTGKGKRDLARGKGGKESSQEREGHHAGTKVRWNAVALYPPMMGWKKRFHRGGRGDFRSGCSF